MSSPVLTPVTQALQQGLLTRRELKTLMHRSDRPALLRLMLWVLLIATTGYLISLALGTLWMLPAMFVHGIVLVHHFSLQHECCHYTAFRTRWVNDVVGYLCGLVIMLPHRFFRYEHCDHHTYTQLTGQDPEQIPMPQSLGEYLLYLSSWPYWKAKFTELFRHVAGRLSPAEQRFVPRSQNRVLVLEARLMSAFYLVILAVCVSTDWWAPLWYWWLPVLFGEPVMRMIRMTEHVGRPAVRDMNINTRTNLVSLPWRFLCWNMNYHAEHHYASSVPFHALPALHRRLYGHLPIEPKGYWGAHADILAQLTGRKPRTDSVTPSV